MTLIRLSFMDLVAEQIREVEELMISQADDHHPELANAIRHLIRSGGKRIRVALVLLIGRMLGTDPARLVTLSASIELLHTATLVHDDLIDGSLMRRGLPTINSRWSPAATVLTGDFIFAKAAKLASEVGSIEVTRLFANTLAIIVNGEISQMFERKGLVSIDEYKKRIYAKTASLFETAAHSAALLSPADKKTILKAREFGYELGMAFQVVDDILDFTGEPETVGKPVASDLRQGLATLPVIIYHQFSPEDDNLEAVILGQADEEMLLHTVERIRTSGAIERSFEEANLHLNRGLDALAVFPYSPEKESLQNLAMYIINRRR